ncbi:MAG: hypothetical protein ACYC9Y_11895 [Candidatus Methylomirabilia bacterium]
MFSRRVFHVVCVVLAGGALAALPGCDWLKGSDPSLRSSPMVSALSIQPSSVLCGGEFSVSFHYEDPQGDIASARVSFRRSGDTSLREETPLWPETISRSSGTVSFPFSFTPKPCTGQGGVWTITVQAEDSEGHTSNTLTGQITLVAVG